MESAIRSAAHSAARRRRSIGVGYGALWWVLGALAAMPAILGMPMFNIDQMAWQSLVRHVAYGAPLGATYGIVRR